VAAGTALVDVAVLAPVPTAANAAEGRIKAIASMIGIRRDGRI
jgi:hypothetical protein